jgi:hypothetical protein
MPVNVVEPGRIRKQVAVGAKGPSPAVERQQLIVDGLSSSALRPARWSRCAPGGAPVSTPAMRRRSSRANPTSRTVHDSMDAHRIDGELVEIWPAEAGIDRG